MKNKRIVIGVSGASGAPLALQFLKELKRDEKVEAHLVITDGGRRTIEAECGCSVEKFTKYADVVYDISDIGATIASGSFVHDGMIVLPCSMKTIAGIASGYSDNLLLRAADVTIKEQRRLVLCVRENPLSRLHLENMARLAGLSQVFIAPMVLSYYHKPLTLEDMQLQLVGKYLDILGIDTKIFKRWKNEDSI